MDATCRHQKQREHRRQDHDDDHCEILVHIAAPTTAKDDARYRAQATAYLAFAPQPGHHGQRPKQPDSPPRREIAVNQHTPRANPSSPRSIRPVVQVISSDSTKKSRPAQENKPFERLPTALRSSFTTSTSSPSFIADSQEPLVPTSPNAQRTTSNLQPKPLSAPFCLTPPSPPPTLIPSSPSPNCEASTLLTPALETLIRTLPPSRLFHPVATTRRLRPFERGHWLFSASALPPATRSRFWRFMADFIVDGRGGWGVWATREPELSDEAGAGGSSLPVRVFCWGAVVPEIWVLLFLASERRIRGAGACWIDGRGAVVVQMP